MVDAFEPENGATRFLPGSTGLAALPGNDSSLAIEVACGPRGALLLYDGAVWHGHGANSTGQWRRSVQGAFIPKSALAALDHGRGLRPEIWSGLSAEVRCLMEN